MKKLLIVLITSLLCLSLSSTVLAEGEEFIVDAALKSNLADFLNGEKGISTLPNKIDRTVYITLVKDIDLNSTNSLVIKENCSVEIDLNGHSITNSSLSMDKPLFENDGVLTIIDKLGSGEVSVNTDKYRSSLILNKGTFCLEDAKLSITKADKSEGNDIAAVITNGENGLNKDCKTYINNGTIATNSLAAIKQYGFSDTYDSLVKIKGGSVNKKIKIDKANNSNKCSLIIDGGEFTEIEGTPSSTHCISNATFTSEISDDLVAVGFEKSNNKLEIITNNEARIDNSCYGSIVDAVNAATAGQTVTLLKDVSKNSASIVVPSEVTLDLNGHNLGLKSVSYFGYIHDSSEIIDDVLYFYGRPQGSLAIQEVSADGKRLLRNLSSAYATVRDKYKLPVYYKAESIYKFYTLSDITYGLGLKEKLNPDTGLYEDNPADFRFKPIIGFFPNGVWKEILNDNTYIKIGTPISLNGGNKILATHSIAIAGNGNGTIYAYDAPRTALFADYCGYGRFTLKFAFGSKASASSCTYTVRPTVFDSYNNFAYYSDEPVSYTFTK